LHVLVLDDNRHAVMQSFHHPVRARREDCGRRQLSLLRLGPYAGKRK